jgi:hypothetical protein
MAQKVQVTLIDDLDGESQADETIAFAIDGQAYEIDLNAANAASMRDLLAPYVAAARKAGRGRASTSARRTRGGDGKVAEIRAWAREQGLPVNERGRIPADLAAKFEEAH